MSRIGKAAASLAIGALAACGTTGAAHAGPVTVRLAYFPNITHATALVGVARGTYAAELGANHLETKTFNAGPAAVEALFSGAIDMAYIGPNPAVNAYVQSHGSAVRIVAGATSGGASLVVKPGIRTAADLRGRKVASPQLGGTQDVALRFWLRSQGLRTDKSGGGDVSVVPEDNAQTLQAFEEGAIAGAWVPEPWASRLVQEGGGSTLVDERSLWPGGDFVSTVLVVRTDFLATHPEAVTDILRAQVRTTEYIEQHPADSMTLANTEIARLTGKSLKPATVSSAWTHERFTSDPLAATLREDIKHAQSVGLIASTDVSRIFDLRLLNGVLREEGKPVVQE